MENENLSLTVSDHLLELYRWAIIHHCILLPGLRPSFSIKFCRTFSAKAGDWFFGPLVIQVVPGTHVNRDVACITYTKISFALGLKYFAVVLCKYWSYNKGNEKGTKMHSITFRKMSHSKTDNEPRQ